MYIILGMINFGDIEEVKYFLSLMGVEYLVLFDILKILNLLLMFLKLFYLEGGMLW